MDLVGPSEPLPDVPKPALTSVQNMQIAKLGAAAERRAFGNLAEQDADLSVRQLLAISADPTVWGIVLGNAQADLELVMGSRYSRVIEWARQVGADEEVARLQLAWRLAQPRAMRPE